MKGKILVCGSMQDLGRSVATGPIGIIYNNPTPDVGFIDPIPSSGLQEKEFESLISYIESAE